MFHPFIGGNCLLFRLIQSRLEFKILLLLIGVLLLGFGSYVIITIESDSRAMLNQERDKVRVSSDWLMEGIRSVMLTGKAPIASEFVNDCRQNFKQADVTIFDRFGREVFLREGEGTRRDVNNPSVNDVLQNSKTLSTMTRQGTAGLFTRYEPLLNRPECWRCHDRREVLRGVLQVALNPVVLNVENDALRQMESSIGNIIATAFRTIMLGGNGEQMDTLIAAVKEIPGVSLTQVYDRKGSLHFGPDVAEIPADRITQLLKMRPIESHFEEFGRKFRLLVPLENQERCQVCHGSKQEMRGVLVLEFSADTLRKYLRDPQKMFTPVLQKAAFEGFRSIMLVGRANCVRFFIDELRTEPVLRSISVFDRAGNERFLNPPARKLEHLKEIVDSLKPIEMMRSVNGNEFFVRLVPLLNEDRCHSCHGATHKVRGIVEISASMKEINDHIRDNEYRSAGIGAITIFFVWMVIRFFMKSLVVGPVLGIEEVAARVGKGDFTAQAKIGSLDEIGSLAKRINQMVNELREKFHLQKFVSQQTVDAVKKSTIEGIKLGGERKSATVFFSDIRGFTAYSEKFEPERVVSMLNRCLSTQAMIIKEFGGDIDKYVGDELVAVFEGTDMVRRAVLAAIKIQKELLKRVHLDDKATIKIGIGINTGEMIMGAMGSEERMDYTVIGDSVNLGARLCSAAEPGQILLSHMSAQHIPNDPELRLRRLDPISVKGKERSVDVYEVIL